MKLPLIVYGILSMQTATALTEKQKIWVNRFNKVCHHEMEAKGGHYDCNIQPGCCEKLKIRYV